MRYCPTRWKDYELIDSGDGEKLERFGEIVLIRPETSALWPKSLSRRDWELSAHATFKHKDAKSGWWEERERIPNEWTISYPFPENPLRLKLKLTQFKHVGVFPEQAVNWEYIHRMVTAFHETENKPANFLNLFAYTGAASVAARMSKAATTHVDSLKQLVTWANENQELNRINNIRWVVEDALKFAEREARRGNKYNGIIMDPPSWGMGPKGEKWRIEDQINALFQAVSEITDEKHFVIINTYSGISPIAVENIANHWFKPQSMQSGEICLESSQKNFIPLGTLVRFTNL
jgi:23S rRNA (cytosine1962-C5)-methyltransferase